MSQEDWDELMKAMLQPTPTPSRCTSRKGPQKNRKQPCHKGRYEPKYEFLLCTVFKNVFGGCNKDPHASTIRLIAEKLRSLECKVNYIEQCCKDKKDREVLEEQPYKHKSPDEKLLKQKCSDEILRKQKCSDEILLKQKHSDEILLKQKYSDEILLKHKISDDKSLPHAPPPAPPPRPIHEEVKREKEGTPPRNEVSSDSIESYDYKEISLHPSKSITDKIEYYSPKDVTLRKTKRTGHHHHLGHGYGTGHVHPVKKKHVGEKRRASDEVYLHPGKHKNHQTNKNLNRITQFHHQETSFIGKRPEIDPSSSHCIQTYIIKRRFDFMSEREPQTSQVLDTRQKLKNYFRRFINENEVSIYERDGTLTPPQVEYSKDLSKESPRTFLYACSSSEGSNCNFYKCSTHGTCQKGVCIYNGSLKRQIEKPVCFASPPSTSSSESLIVPSHVVKSKSSPLIRRSHTRRMIMKNNN